MITCPKCDKTMELRKWWKKHRLPTLKKIESQWCEYQTKFVANNNGKGVDVTQSPEYIKSEERIKKVWRLMDEC